VASTDRMGICPWLPGRTTREKMEVEPHDPPLEYIQSQLSQAGRITWGSRVANLARLEVLAMEFETEIRKERQLDVVVERAKAMEVSQTRRTSSALVRRDWRDKVGRPSISGRNGEASGCSTGRAPKTYLRRHYPKVQTRKVLNGRGEGVHQELRRVCPFRPLGDSVTAICNALS
jgi:hypothetical protein